jgi:hypothetical protein
MRDSSRRCSSGRNVGTISHLGEVVEIPLSKMWFPQPINHHYRKVSALRPTGTCPVLRTYTSKRAELRFSRLARASNAFPQGIRAEGVLSN